MECGAGEISLDDTIKPQYGDDKAAMKAACGRLLQRLQLLAGLESHGLSRGYGNLRPRPRIPPDARLPRLHVEHPKASQLDAVALLQRALHALKDGLHR